MEVKKLSAGKRKLLDYLGAPYKVMVIDLEKCVYLDLGDYDIEISGGKTIYSDFDIYVWNKKDLRIIEKHMGVKSDLPSIKELLNDIRTKYLTTIFGKLV